VLCWVFADDFVGVTVSPTSGLVCLEAGGVARFSVVLTSQPTSSVTVGVNSSDLTEGDLGSVAAVTFATGSWSTPQTVTVTGVDDDVMDGNISFVVALSAAMSDDGNYHGLNRGGVNVTNADGRVWIESLCLTCIQYVLPAFWFVFFCFADDSVGVTTSPSTGLVCSEVGHTAVFSLALTSEPTSFVTVGVVSSDTTEGSLGNVSAVTFTAGSWSTPQTVTVTGANDDIVDGNVTFSVLVQAATSSDTNYNGVDGNDVNVSTGDRGELSCWLLGMVVGHV
jgi:hypothetical protein